MLEGGVRLRKENGKCAKFFATDREVVHVTHASKRGMVYSDNIQENGNYENGI